MEFQYNDGGRAAAGYKGHTSDCVTRAIAIAAEKPYQEVYDDLNRLCKSTRGKKKFTARSGVPRRVYEPYLKALGFKWVPTMGIGTGCTCHLADSELPKGKLIIRASRHLTTVIDGVIHDTYNPSRGETRCVYGYFIKK